MRKIIHIDMDAFFASVEQRDDASLRGRPVLVGGRPGGRGVVAAASYEARAFGVRSAMPASRAARLCPEAIFIAPRFAHYQAVAARIRAIFAEVTALVEPLALDEAYLDVSQACAAPGAASAMAGQLRARIREQTALSASAGVSYNKFLAKLACEQRKPDGQFTIAPGQGEAFVAALPIGAFHGVGPATERRMHALGIRNGADLARWSAPALAEHFGSWATFLYQIARGIDERPVNPHRERKSIGAERTFASDLVEPAQMRAQLIELAERVGAALHERAQCALSLSLKVRYPDFSTVSRQCRAPQPLRGADDIRPLLDPLLARTEAGARPVRLLGLSAGALRPAQLEGAEQLRLPLRD